MTLTPLSRRPLAARSLAAAWEDCARPAAASGFGTAARLLKSPQRQHLMLRNRRQPPQASAMGSCSWGRAAIRRLQCQQQCCNRTRAMVMSGLQRCGGRMPVRVSQPRRISAALAASRRLSSWTGGGCTRPRTAGRRRTSAATACHHVRRQGDALHFATWWRLQHCIGRVRGARHKSEFQSL